MDTLTFADNRDLTTDVQAFAGRFGLNEEASTALNELLSRVYDEGHSVGWEAAINNDMA